MKWVKANFQEKREIIEELQKITSICKICSLLGHSSAKCYKKEKAVCENKDCGKVHIKDMCEYQAYITGCLQLPLEPPPVGGGMSLQDVSVSEDTFDSTARTLFDGQ